MAKVAQVYEDMVLGSGTGIVGPTIPDDLESLPLWNLRYVNGEIVDVSANTSWYIDDRGQKHIVNAAGRQALTCLLNDALIKDESGTWIVRPLGWTPVPKSVTPLQMRKALRQEGLKTSIDTYLAAQDEEVQEAWEYATEVDRDNDMIAACATALGKTTQEIDDLFRLAATL